MPLKMGTSRDIVHSNIKEMVKSGHPVHSAIAASLNMKRKSQHMAQGGEVRPIDQLPHEAPSMEPNASYNQIESDGPHESDMRDIIDQGTHPKPHIPSRVDHGSPEHEMDNQDGPMEAELKELLKRHKMRRG